MRMAWDDKFSNGPPKVEISEQPSSSVRFRYECEGRSAGSIPGVSSVTPDRKTYPSIQLKNFQGRIHVTVSCVTAMDTKPKAHPHSLVGKNCNDGVCQFYHEHPLNGIIDFPGLGIQCARRKERKEALMKRKQMNIDPFKMGFEHADQAIDVTQVRLCFQVCIYQMTGDGQQKWVPIKPAVTHVIYDRRSVSELNIARISRCSGSVNGGDEIYILCDKVSKDNIAVQFFEEQNGATCWAESAEILFVHKQVAMIVKTPAYKNQNLEKSVEVKMKLYRPSDKEESTPVPYRYYAFYEDFSDNLRKKPKIEGLDIFPPKLSPAEPRVFKQPTRAAMVHTAPDRVDVKDSPSVKLEGERPPCDIPYIEQQPGFSFPQPILPCQPFSDVLSINNQFSPVATQSFLLATSSTAPIQQSIGLAPSTTQSFAHNAVNSPLSVQPLGHLSTATTQPFPFAVPSTAINLQSRALAPMTTQTFVQSPLASAPTKQTLGDDVQLERPIADNSSLPNLELEECCLSGMSALSLEEDRVDGAIQAEQMSIGTLPSLPQTGNSIEWLSKTVQGMSEDYCRGANPMNGSGALDG